MKRIFSFALRFIPRPVLQRFVHLVTKLLIPFYLGKKVQCSVCDIKLRKFLPYGRLEPRENALCPKCLSLERHRLINLFLKEKTDFYSADHKILHVAPEVCFINRFEKQHGDNYITGDIESPWAKVKMDVHDIPFEENTFDVVFCNHVLEHVEDDIKVLKEFYRVLKPGGWAVLQSPIDYSYKTTYEDKSITDPRVREKAFGQDDHLRMFGVDYGERLKLGGFTVEEHLLAQEMGEAEAFKYGLDKREIMYLSKKVV